MLPVNESYLLSQGHKHSYRFRSGRLIVYVYEGDITKVKDAIVVNSANRLLSATRE